ncbi:uncharacterized protein RJT20DRAFT_133081 [Scheffersomyces xylosifermentans]|uniref:uncharacterized protein n=1 Tax=Scheffersomyces xylosifermentans TaxID=1304137 RepID=UPI00315D18F2
MSSFDIPERIKTFPDDIIDRIITFLDHFTLNRLVRLESRIQPLVLTTMYKRVHIGSPDDLGEDKGLCFRVDSFITLTKRYPKLIFSEIWTNDINFLQLHHAIPSVLSGAKVIGIYPSESQYNTQRFQEICSLSYPFNFHYLVSHSGSGLEEQRYQFDSLPVSTVGLSFDKSSWEEFENLERLSNVTNMIIGGICFNAHELNYLPKNLKTLELTLFPPANEAILNLPLPKSLNDLTVHIFNYLGTSNFKIDLSHLKNIGRLQIKDPVLNSLQRWTLPKSVCTLEVGYLTIEDFDKLSHLENLRILKVDSLDYSAYDLSQLPQHLEVVDIRKVLGFGVGENIMKVPHQLQLLKINTQASYSIPSNIITNAISLELDYFIEVVKEIEVSSRDLSSLCNLTRLSIDCSELKSPSQINLPPSLAHLRLACDGLEDLKGLEELTKLRSLDIDGTFSPMFVKYLLRSKIYPDCLNELRLRLESTRSGWITDISMDPDEYYTGDPNSISSFMDQIIFLVYLRFGSLLQLPGNLKKFEIRSKSLIADDNITFPEMLEELNLEGIAGFTNFSNLSLPGNLCKLSLPYIKWRNQLAKFQFPSNLVELRMPYGSPQVSKANHSYVEFLDVYPSKPKEFH